MTYRENITIPQSAEIGTPLFVVMASDTDLDPENTRVSFTLLNTSFPFAINSTSGNMSVSEAISQPGLYEVYVEVSDMGSPQLSSVSIFYVIVAPPNFYDPVFPANLTLSFNEEAIPSTPVFNFTVTDDDNEAEGEVTLSLLPSEYSSDFFPTQTGNTGFLYVNTSFDRETITNFTLAVQAVDNGNPMFRRSSEAELVVLILDINDNPPVFTNAPYAVSVAEDAFVGYSIFQASATDRDVGLNAEILFSLEDGEGVFGIDSTSGNITVQGQLLRANTSFYRINITARDQGVDMLESYTFINITVTEVNDNAPVFVGITQQNFVIPENTEPGYVFPIEVNVTDADTGPAAIVDLSLAQSGNVFVLRGNRLVLDSAVDYEVPVILSVEIVCILVN